ncbi:hypothetical protein AOLI_G00067420 [Acnodon oligacanthus]
MTHIGTLHSLLLGLFITGCLCGPDLTVWQSPEIIKAAEGQQVSISCHFRTTTPWQRLRVEWWRNNTTELRQESYNISALNSTNHSSVLPIPSVRLSDSGIYCCAVWQDLPTLGEKVYGPGTELRVDDVPSHGSNVTTTNHSAVTVLGASVLTSVLITVFITCVAFIVYRGRRTRSKQQREGEPAPAEEASSVLYAALNIRKPQDRKNTPEVRDLYLYDGKTFSHWLCSEAGWKSNADSETHGCYSEYELLNGSIKTKRANINQ